MLSQDRFQKITQSFPSLKPILVIGDVGVDKYTLGDVKRISPEAPVPVLEVSKEWKKLGLAANVADNLQGLKISNTLCGIVGDDTNASVMEHLLEESKLKASGLVRDPDRMTTFKERVVTETQQICRVDYETKETLSKAIELKIWKKIQEYSENHTAVIIEDYGKGLFSESLCQNIISHFHEQNKLVTVDPSRSTPPLWYKGAHLLKPNLVESKLMVEALGYHKKDSLDEIAEILMDKLKLKKLIITLGAKGMALKDEAHSKLTIIPTLAKEVFDVSGAGDTAIATITASLVAGSNLEEAAWIGNCASGVVVGKKGTAKVSPKELSDFYENILKSKLQ